MANVTDILPLPLAPSSMEGQKAVLQQDRTGQDRVVPGPGNAAAGFLLRLNYLYRELAKTILVFRSDDTVSAPGFASSVTPNWICT